MITHTVDLHEYLSDNIYDYPLMSMGKVGKSSVNSGDQFLSVYTKTIVHRVPKTLIFLAGHPLFRTNGSVLDASSRSHHAVNTEIKMI
jgi:hypothetical protein